jgi:hypothetical protein
VEAREVIARRSDLSTFLVHLTRTSGAKSAPDRLRAILETGQLDAASMFGMAKKKLEEEFLVLDSQKCVCFTETPLEYVHLLLHPLENRQVELAPYGIAFPKKLGRAQGVNPVWYLDITPGHGWLTGPVDNLVDEAMAGDGLDDHPIGRLTPFIEQMGTHRNDDGTLRYRKEFWWEREWRHVGNFRLPGRVIVLCPENEFAEFRAIVDADDFQSATFVDPRWGLEQIISRLSGFSPQDSDIL